MRAIALASTDMAARAVNSLITRNCHPPDGGYGPAIGNTCPRRGRVPGVMASTPLQVATSVSEQGEIATAKAPPGSLPDTREVMGKSRLENFRVANPILPRPLRADLYALYGFARLVDDIGDEAQGDRVAMLDWLDAELDALYEGRPQHELMQRLLPTVRAHAIPPEPFRR